MLLGCPQAHPAGIACIAGFNGAPPNGGLPPRRLPAQVHLR